MWMLGVNNGGVLGYKIRPQDIGYRERSDMLCELAKMFSKSLRIGDWLLSIVY
jgi:hypothetical protein